MPAERRKAERRTTQRNLRLTDAQLAAIEELCRRTARGKRVPRERYLRAVIERHVTSVIDDEHFDAWRFVDGSEDPVFRAGMREAIAVIDRHRGETSRLEFLQRAVRGLAGDSGVLDSLCDALIVTDADRRITRWNGGAESLFGWSAAEALGQRTVEFFTSASSRHDEARRFAELVRDGAWRGVDTWFGKDDRPVRCELRAQTLPAGGFVAVFREMVTPSS